MGEKESKKVDRINMLTVEQLKCENQRYFEKSVN